MNKVIQKKLWMCVGLWKVFVLASPVLAGSYLGVRDLGERVRFGPGWLAEKENPAGAGRGDSLEISVAGQWLLSSRKTVSAPRQTDFEDEAGDGLGGVAVGWGSPKRPLGVGLVIFPLLDFNHQNHSIFKDGSGVVSAETRLESQGALWSFSPSMVWGFSRGFSAGFSYCFLWGKEKINLFQRSVSSGTILDFNEKASYRGGRFVLGAFWRNPTEKWTLSGQVGFSHGVNRVFSLNSSTQTGSLTADEKWQWPLHWRAQFSGKFGQRPETTFSMNLTQTFWSRTRREGRSLSAVTSVKPIFEKWETVGHPQILGTPIPRSFRDVTGIEVILDHRFPSGWSFLYAYRQEPEVAESSVEGNFFSLGLGFEDDSGGWRWVMAMEFGKRDFKGDNLYFAADQRVDETLWRVSIQGTYRVFPSRHPEEKRSFP